MNEEDVTIATKNKKLIFEITNSILLKEKPAEALFTNEFVDRYINTLETGGAKTNPHSVEDTPLGFGGGSLVNISHPTHNRKCHN